MMSSSSNDYVAVIYHSGGHFEGPDGVQFEGKTKMLKINRATTYNQLKEMICRKLGLHGSHLIHRLIAKVETVVGFDSVYYISNDVGDDEDVECIIDAFDNWKSQNFIEIYVEVESDEASSVPTHTRSPQYYGQEDRAVSLSAPLQALSQLRLMEEGEDHEDECEEDEDIHSEEGEPDSVVPLGDSSNTDVEGDSLSPLRVDPVSSSLGTDIEPFLNKSPHYSSINWVHLDDETEILYGDDDTQGGWHLGDPCYLYQQFPSKRWIQNEMDWVESQPLSSQSRCRHCKQVGHNIRTCPLRNRQG